MSSPNPDLTPNLQLPSPKPADPPDVPGDIKALADKLDQVLVARLVQPIMIKRDRDDLVGGGQWGQSVGWSGTMPAGTVICLATYAYSTTSKSYFRIRANGTDVVKALQDFDTDKNVVTLTGGYNHAGGALAVSAEFGFANNDVNIMAGSNLTVICFPTSNLITSGGSQDVLTLQP